MCSHASRIRLPRSSPGRKPCLGLELPGLFVGGMEWHLSPGVALAPKPAQRAGTSQWSAPLVARSTRAPGLPTMLRNARRRKPRRRRARSAGSGRCAGERARRRLVCRDAWSLCTAAARCLARSRSSSLRLPRPRVAGGRLSRRVVPLRCCLPNATGGRCCRRCSGSRTCLGARPWEESQFVVGCPPPSSAAAHRAVREECVGGIAGDHEACCPDDAFSCVGWHPGDCQCGRD